MVAAREIRLPGLSLRSRSGAPELFKEGRVMSALDGAIVDTEPPAGCRPAFVRSKVGEGVVTAEEFVAGEPDIADIMEELFNGSEPASSISRRHRWAITSTDHDIAYAPAELPKVTRPWIVLEVSLDPIDSLAGQRVGFPCTCLGIGGAVGA